MCNVYLLNQSNLWLYWLVHEVRTVNSGECLAASWQQVFNASNASSLYQWSGLLLFSIHSRSTHCSLFNIPRRHQPLKVSELYVVIVNILSLLFTDSMAHWQLFSNTYHIDIYRTDVLSSGHLLSWRSLNSSSFIHDLVLSHL